MNTNTWLHHFAQNAHRSDALQLPDAPCTLPDSIRVPLARSIAIFQLGESGGGTRIRRYVQGMAPAEHFRGYQRAVDLFIAEEQGHAALLAKVVAHLRGTLLQKQWSNSIFRWMRNLVNVEFNIQVLLTAELIAEVYYGTLLLRTPDETVRTMAKKIVRDEVKHLSFQRAFLSERLAEFSPRLRQAWTWQFRIIHWLTTQVVAWDHADCLRALGVAPAHWRQRCKAALTDFERRLWRQTERVQREGFLMPEEEKSSSFIPA